MTPASESRSSAIGGTVVRATVLSIASVVVGTLFVALAGFLAIRVIGAESGAVFDLNNVVVGVRSPGPAYLSMLALAVLGVVVAYVVTLGTARLPRRDRLVVAGAFGLALLCLVAWGVQGSWVHAVDGEPVLGVSEGWRGWLQEGARSSGTHVVLLAVLGWLWHLRRQSVAGETAEAYDSVAER